jgi:hypothetical protein
MADQSTTVEASRRRKVCILEGDGAALSVTGIRAENYQGKGGKPTLFWPTILVRMI